MAIDLHEYAAGPLLIPKEPHRITGTKFPVTLGHEFGGIVEETGEGVTRVSVEQSGGATDDIRPQMQFMPHGI